MDEAAAGRGRGEGGQGAYVCCHLAVNLSAGAVRKNAGDSHAFVPQLIADEVAEVVAHCLVDGAVRQERSVLQLVHGDIHVAHGVERSLQVVIEQGTRIKGLGD